MYIYSQEINYSNIYSHLPYKYSCSCVIYYKGCLSKTFSIKVETSFWSNKLGETHSRKNIYKLRGISMITSLSSIIIYTQKIEINLLSEVLLPNEKWHLTLLI